MERILCTGEFMRYAVLIIAAVCVTVFVLQNIIPGLTNALILTPANFHGYELITHIFLHADYLHIFYNMFALLLFGLLLENVIGSKNILILFFAAGIVAGFSAFIFYADSSVLGASGAIMGIIGALGVLRPKQTVWVIGVPMPMIAAVVVWAFLDLAGLVSGGQGIANGAHLFGLAIGLIYGFAVRKNYKVTFLKKDRNKVVSDDELDKWEENWMNHN